MGPPGRTGITDRMSIDEAWGPGLTHQLLYENHYHYYAQKPVVPYKQLIEDSSIG